KKRHVLKFHTTDPSLDVRTRRDSDVHHSSEISSGCTRTRFSGTSPAPDQTKTPRNRTVPNGGRVQTDDDPHNKPRSLRADQPLAAPRQPTTPLSSSITCVCDCKRATSSTSNRQARQRTTTSVWGRAKAPLFFPT
ncbi:unnamed protein product, partial [Ectocarpus sp. 4 AP-2014]